jgi:signal transduction histidine kinase/DNA-binding response OmpR family regulator
MFRGGGEMGERMRAIDWTATPLGSPDSWPESLRSALSICLGSRFPIAIYWGSELCLLYNDAWSPILGAKHPWALGRGAREVWPEIWSTIGPMFADVVATGEATYSEDGLLPMNRHGYVEECYFNFTFTPIRGEGGRVEGIFNAVIETTFRVLSERRNRVLRDLGERLLPLRSPDEVFEVAAAALADADKDVAFCALYRLEGERARRLAAHRIDDDAAPALISLLDSSAAWPLGRAFASRKVELVTDLTDRSTNVTPGGWPEPANAAFVVPISDGGGAPQAFLIAGANPRRAVEEQRDLFERAATVLSGALGATQAYEVERKRAEALAAIDRAKTAFFSNISHEFRTPLTLMIGPTEDALASPEKSLAGSELDIVYRNELRLLRLVNTLLDFSRMEAGRARVRYEAIDLAETIRDLASLFRSAIERAGLALVIECDPSPEPAYIDREMWEKIVMNLLSNAFKFTFEGTITLSLRYDGEEVVLQVRDTGVGIASEHLPRLFERFHRIEGVRARSFEGSGIGLALVQDLVQLHHGTIAAESEVGKGSTFTVRIPRGDASLASKRTDSESYAPRNAEAFAEEFSRALPYGTAVSGNTADRATILLADDNGDMREYVAKLLRKQWHVDAVGDGASALRLLREKQYDLVLTDALMPELDGFGLLREIRTDPALRSTSVILLSARAGEEARIAGLESGADDYLVKPFSARELVARVSAHLQLAALRKTTDRERTKLSRMFRDLPVAIVMFEGPEHRYVLSNPASQLFLSTPDQSIGKPLLELLPEIAGQPVLGILDRVYATGEPAVLPEVGIDLDVPNEGRVRRWYNGIYHATHDALGRVNGVIACGVDITETVVARELLERARAEADSANRAKDEFLAMLGHELRNPLAPIVTALQLMKLRGSDRTERERTIIERQVEHLVRLIDDLLDVSRITRGKIQLKRERIEIARVVAQAIEMAGPLIEQRRHELVVRVDREGLLVDADPARLAQVVANLLTNAAKYTEPRGRIEIVAERVENGIELSVRDNGIGIASEMLPRIFEMFAQEKQALDRSEGGLGLGLTIVRSMVALHGGTVRAHSDGRGHGSEFVVQLPRALEASRPRSSSGEWNPRVTSERATRRVLVVDDNRDAAMLVAEFLSCDGYVVECAVDGPAALRVLERFVPDVALLDIGLPVMDGYELAQRIRETEEGRNIPLVAVTGYGQERDRELSKAAGFVSHVVKPVDLRELERLLDELTRPPPGETDTETRAS